MEISKEEWKEWLELDQTKEIIIIMKKMRTDILDATQHNPEDANSLINLVGRALGISACIRLLEGVAK